jgi:2Fe-2S ferredoxin
LTGGVGEPIPPPAGAASAPFINIPGVFRLMGVIHVIDRAGERHTLEALEGWRVMEIIRDWNLPIEGICGGACECATCHVFVSDEWLQKLFPKSEEEESQLDMVPIVQPNSRLSCQILWTPELDGLEVTLAPVSA